MKQHRTLALAFLALMATTPALHAQHADHEDAHFDGTWEVSLETQMGAQVWTFIMEVEDHAITGVATTQVGNMPIEGTQEGDNVEFVLFLNAPDHAVEFMFSGKIDGDAAEGSVMIVDESFAWTATRADSR